VKIIVLVKQVPDTYEDRKLNTSTGLIDRAANEPIIDEVAERALEAALSYKDSHKDAEVVVLSMGPTGVTTALRKALSMGADSALHVSDDQLVGSDYAQTAKVLAAAIQKAGFDLVIAGNESTDGRGGVVPAMIAEHLSLPHATFLRAYEISDSEVKGTRVLESGTAEVRTALPAIISVTEQAPEARFPSFKGIMGAKKKPLDVLTVADLGVELGGSGASVVVSTTQRPAREAGTKIVDEGNAGVELAGYLATNRLI
jgi:electron transfer flavoprotein beta subunit